MRLVAVVAARCFEIVTPAPQHTAMQSCGAHAALMRHGRHHVGSSACHGARQVAVVTPSRGAEWAAHRARPTRLVHLVRLVRLHVRHEKRGTRGGRRGGGQSADDERAQGVGQPRLGQRLEQRL